MTASDLLLDLEGRGVRLGLRLAVDAPEGALGPEHRAALRAHRSALLVRLARDAQWEGLRGERWGPGLTDPTPGIVIDGPKQTADPEPTIEPEADPFDSLVGPERTDWGTLAWSDPSESPIAAFGPPQND